MKGRQYVFGKYDSDLYVKTNEALSEVHTDLMNKVYGRKYCTTCGGEKPVYTFVKDGSWRTSMKDTTLQISFTGAQICTVCYGRIE